MALCKYVTEVRQQPVNMVVCMVTAIAQQRMPVVFGQFGSVVARHLERFASVHMLRSATSSARVPVGRDAIAHLWTALMAKKEADADTIDSTELRVFHTFN